MPSEFFYLREIKLTNFRNYDFRSISFSEKLNFIVGNNGVGKTNLLDAVYYSCLTKSYLSSSDLLVTSFDADFFRIESDFILSTQNQCVVIKYIKQEKKEVWMDNSKLEKQADYIGRFPCVIIIPDDNQLILGGSDIRRKFIDSTISQFSREYFSTLVTHNKILARRNALLKFFFESRTFDRNLLDVYNETIITTANILFKYRVEFLEQFIPVFKSVYKQIFDGKEDISITYESDLFSNDYESIIIEFEQQDRTAQRTTKGIHTDDLVFELNGYPLKKTASQGQQKTFLLSLKLAQFELLKSNKHMRPLLLLDDIFDKLDAERVAKIFKLIHNNSFGQVFITHTNEASISSLIIDNKIDNYKIINLGSI